MGILPYSWICKVNLINSFRFHLIQTVVVRSTPEAVPYNAPFHWKGCMETAKTDTFRHFTVGYLFLLELRLYTRVMINNAAVITDMTIIIIFSWPVRTELKSSDTDCEEISSLFCRISDVFEELPLPEFSDDSFFTVWSGLLSTETEDLLFMPVPAFSECSDILFSGMLPVCSEDWFGFDGAETSGLPEGSLFSGSGGSYWFPLLSAISVS